MPNTGVSPCLARDTPTGTPGLLGNTAGLQAFCLLRTGPYAWHQDTLQIDGFSMGHGIAYQGPSVCVNAQRQTSSCRCETRSRPASPPRLWRRGDASPRPDGESRQNVSGGGAASTRSGTRPRRARSRAGSCRRGSAGPGRATKRHSIRPPLVRPRQGDRTSARRVHGRLVARPTAAGEREIPRERPGDGSLEREPAQRPPGGGSESLRAERKTSRQTQSAAGKSRLPA